MKLSVLALTVVSLSACSPGPVEHRDAGPDAGARDAGSLADAGSTVDAGSTDAGTASTCLVPDPACALLPVADPAFCEAQVALEPDAPLVGQDTASGGFGDCAASASGFGGPSLYYSVTVPAGRFARVVAVPVTPAEPALVRAFASCDVTTADDADRGGQLSNGRAGVCLANPTSAERHVVIAVSQYSGEQDCRPLVFDISVAVHDGIGDCPPGGFEPPGG